MTLYLFVAQWGAAAWMANVGRVQTPVPKASGQSFDVRPWSVLAICRFCARRLGASSQDRGAGGRELHSEIWKALEYILVGMVSFFPSSTESVRQRRYRILPAMAFGRHLEAAGLGHGGTGAFNLARERLGTASCWRSRICSEPDRS